MSYARSGARLLKFLQRRRSYTEMAPCRGFDPRSPG